MSPAHTLSPHTSTAQVRDDAVDGFRGVNVATDLNVRCKKIGLPVNTPTNRPFWPQDHLNEILVGFPVPSI